MSKRQSQKEYEQWCQQSGNVFTDDMARGAFVFQPSMPTTMGNGNTKKSAYLAVSHGKVKMSGKVYRY